MDNLQRIGIPEGMTISTVICVKSVETCVHDKNTEFLVEGFTRDTFGGIYEVDLVLCESDISKVFKMLGDMKEGAMFRCDNEICRIENGRLSLLYPDLTPWHGEPFDLDHVLEKENVQNLNVRTENLDLEQIARKVVNRSKRQRHYLYHDVETRPSRKVKDLWTYGREEYGLQKIFVYLPHQSEIPLDEFAELLSRIDGKLERSGDFRRVLCSYGCNETFESKGQSSFIKGRFKASKDEWLTALTMLTEQQALPENLIFATFHVNYRHAFGTKSVIKPKRTDPVILVTHSCNIELSEKAIKSIRAYKKKLSWINYDHNLGWAVDCGEALVKRIT